MALGIVPSDLDSPAKDFADLKAELEKEKAAQEMAHAKVGMLAQATNVLKISSNKFTAQVPILEEKVKHLENKVVDGLNEVRDRELCLECMTKANDD
jgi:hypothetical protein